MNRPVVFFIPLFLALVSQIVFAKPDVELTCEELVLEAETLNKALTMETEALNKAFDLEMRALKKAAADSSRQTNADHMSKAGENTGVTVANAEKNQIPFTEEAAGELLVFDRTTKLQEALNRRHTLESIYTNKGCSES